MVSRHVFELCTSPETLIAALAEDPDQPVSKLVKRLFKSRCTRIKQQPNDPIQDSPDQFDVVAKCGHFPHRPSHLFLLVCSHRLLPDLL